MNLKAPPYGGTTGTTSDRMRAQGFADGRAIADRLALTIIEAAAVLPDADAAVTPALEAEVALAATRRKAAGVGEAAPRQFTTALATKLINRG